MGGLGHEPRDDAVERAAFVAEAPLPRRQCPEVLDGPRDDVAEEADGDAAGGGPVDRHVKEHLVGHGGARPL